LSQVVYHEHALNYDSIANETMKLAIHLKVWPVAFEQGSQLMGYYLDSLIQPKRALAIFDDLKPKVTELKDEQQLGTYYLNGSNAHYFLRDYGKSLDLANMALPLLKKSDNQTLLSKCFFRLGGIHAKLSNYDQAHSYYFESLKIDESLQDERGVAVNLEKIGEIYLLTSDYEKAESNFHKAIATYTKLNDGKGIIFNYTNLGASYQKRNNCEEALKYYQAGLDMATKIDLKRSQSLFLGNIGSCNRRLGNYDVSLDYLFRALDLKLELGRLGSAAHSCNDIAETYIKLDRYDLAKQYALKAIGYAKGNNLNQERYAYYVLSQCNAQLGENKAAYENLQRFNTLQDSIYNIQKIARINEMRIMYETEKRDLRLKAQESDIAFLNERNTVKNQYIAFGSIGLLSLFGFIILVRSRNKEKQRKQLQEQFARDLLKSQEDERTRIAKDLHDSVGQQLTLIKQKSQNVQQMELSDLTHNALEEVRSISRGLYPALLKQLGLTASIEQLVLEYDEETELFFSIELSPIDDAFDEMESLNFYRFIQEALNNAIKHSQAKAISVDVSRTQSLIVAKINDNGVGFNVQDGNNQNSLGLKTLYERIRILNGTLLIESIKGKGTMLTAKIKLTS
ncbi:MAG: sensor histidine kinase, partial [Croceitalea sp.]|nr:sensor histidine kinase [Croceitalea sp.]